MPVSVSYPGVYIEEVPSGVRTIVGVSTSVAAFVGHFTRGPVNYPVQLFNEGDLQRELGGLHRDSEAGYAIRQFFLNGGSTAWVVRAEAAGSLPAKVIMQDEAGNPVLEAMAGRRIGDDSVPDNGSWGNRLRIDIDYDTQTPAETFNLTVVEVAADGVQVAASETFRNLSMAKDSPRYVVDTVNTGSQLIQLAWHGTGRPAQTGTTGEDASAALAGGIHKDNDTFWVNSNPVDLELTDPVASLAEVRKVLQAAIRKTGISVSDAMLSGATVELIGKQLRVLAGRNADNYATAAMLDFKEDGSGADAAAKLGLLNAFNNVQQYQLGATTDEAAQEKVTDGHGSDGSGLPGATELIGERSTKTGLYALEEVDLFNILCIPRAAKLIPATAMQEVYNRAGLYCEERRAFLLIDLPCGVTDLEAARDWLEDNAGLRRANAAAYFPNPRVPDPLNDFRLRSVGASGTIAGLYARTDATRGVWKAPAGIEATLRNVSELSTRLSDPENGQLNPLGLNCLRTFDVYGTVSWGARTLNGADRLASEWKYIPVRRLALYLEESLFRGTQWVVFEPNDEPLWAQIRLNIGSFMHDLFRQGAFQGSTPREAYLVKCDRETTPQSDIDKGIVNIVVGFAPLKPAEFVIIKIQQLAGRNQA